jgi:hypothetical protein
MALSKASAKMLRAELCVHRNKTLIGVVWDGVVMAFGLV